MQIFSQRLPLVASLALAISFCANADVTLPGILAEHMVIQRDLPVHIWGKATPKEAVSVAFRGATQATAADTLGRWSVFLPPGEAGGPFELTIKGADVAYFRVAHRMDGTILLKPRVLTDAPAKPATKKR